MDDFKNALILCITTSEAKSKTELMGEIMEIFYMSAYGDGRRDEYEDEKNEWLSSEVKSNGQD